MVIMCAIIISSVYVYMCMCVYPMNNAMPKTITQLPLPKITRQQNQSSHPTHINLLQPPPPHCCILPLLRWWIKCLALNRRAISLRVTRGRILLGLLRLLRLLRLLLTGRLVVLLLWLAVVITGVKLRGRGLARDRARRRGRLGYLCLVLLLVGVLWVRGVHRLLRLLVLGVQHGGLLCLHLHRRVVGCLGCLIRLVVHAEGVSVEDERRDEQEPGLLRFELAHRLPLLVPVLQN